MGRDPTTADDRAKNRRVAHVAAAPFDDAALLAPGRCGKGLRYARRRDRSPLAVLIGLWEGYRGSWMAAGWTWPFAGQRRRRCRTWTILKAFEEPAQVNQPALATILWHKTLFTAKEAVFGFAIGAIVGFALGVLLAQWRVLQRGFMPYIVGSQTIPILAIAPMVVIWVNPKLPGPLQGWGAVAVIAAYLTFFPVAINTLRGLQSADPRALELMRTYAASELGRALEGARARRRCRTSSPRSRSPPPPASSARSSASCPRGSRTASAARSSTSTSTTRSSRRSCGRRTSSPPRSGSSSSSRSCSSRSSSSAARRSTSHERQPSSSRSRASRRRSPRGNVTALAGHRPATSSRASSSR